MTQMFLLRAAMAAVVLSATTLMPAAAQDTGALTSGKDPIAIDATEGIEWRQDEKVYIARGNAKATRGDVTVEANELRAHYRLDDKDQTQVYKVEAVGNVVITTPSETVRGGYGIYLLDEGIFQLTGGTISIERKGGEKLTASRKLEYRQKAKVAIADGDATVYKEDKTLRADRLTAYFKGGEKDQKLDYVDATGGVVVTSPNEVVRADGAKYDAAKEVVTLIGNVRMTRGGNQLNGERAEVDLKRGRSRLLAGAKGSSGSKPVSGLFVPGAKGGPSLDGILKEGSGEKKEGKDGATKSGGETTGAETGKATGKPKPVE